MNPEIAYILVSVGISVVFSQAIYAWLAKTIGEVTFAARGIELWDEKEALIGTAHDSDNMQMAGEISRQMSLLTDAQNQAGIASEKLTRCNLAIFIFLCFVATILYILNGTSQALISESAEIWIMMLGLSFIYGTYFLWSNFGQNVYESDPQSRYPLLILISTVQLGVWYFFGYNWLTASTSFVVTCVIATPIYNIISTHQSAVDEVGAINPNISSSDYVGGSHVEMLVTASCFALIIILAVRLIKTATPRSIATLYKAAFNPKI